jgi:Uma2 family endonuclease
MATSALDPAYRRMTVEEFLDLEIEGRAELEDGILYMMSGGTARHAAIIVNIATALHNKLRGTGCRPMSSDMALLTRANTVRMPDISVYCGMPLSKEQEQAKLLGDPKVVIEVLSPSTRGLDLRIKVAEYCGLSGVHAALFVDPDSQRVRVLERNASGEWLDDWIEAGHDVRISAIDVTLTAEDIFLLD